MLILIISLRRARVESFKISALYQLVPCHIAESDHISFGDVNNMEHQHKHKTLSRFMEKCSSLCFLPSKVLRAWSFPGLVRDARYWRGLELLSNAAWFRWNTDYSGNRWCLFGPLFEQVVQKPARLIKSTFLNLRRVTLENAWKVQRKPASLLAQIARTASEISGTYLLKAQRIFSVLVQIFNEVGCCINWRMHCQTPRLATYADTVEINLSFINCPLFLFDCLRSCQLYIDGDGWNENDVTWNIVHNMHLVLSKKFHQLWQGTHILFWPQT